MNKFNYYFLILSIILVFSFVSSSIPSPLSVNKNQVNVDNNQCQICELLVKDIIECLTANTSVKEIERELNLICDRIPLHFRVCKQFVDSNLEKIVQFIENNDDPQQICQKCGACPSGESAQKIKNTGYDRYFPQHNQNHQRRTLRTQQQQQQQPHTK